MNYNLEKFKEFCLKYEKKLICAFILVLFSITLFFLFKKYNDKETTEKIIMENKVEENLVVDNVEEKKQEEYTTNIFVDIKGEVKNPGVYEIETNKRVIDAIELAGGLTNEADTSNINLSKILKDETVIVINTYKVNNEKNESDTSSNNYSIETETVTQNNSLININTATKEELMTLSGIGESKANAIISYRTENNGFKNIDEILEVSGIGESLYAIIKENITT